MRLTRQNLAGAVLLVALLTLSCSRTTVAEPVGPAATSSTPPFPDAREPRRIDRRPSTVPRSQSDAQITPAERRSAPVLSDVARSRSDTAGL